MNASQWTAAGLLALFFASCQATGPTWDEIVDSIPPLQENKGRVYFYRAGTLEAMGSRPFIYMNATRVGRSQAGGFFWVDDVPGLKEVVAADWTDHTVRFVLKAKETKYVKTTPVQGFLIVQIAPQIVATETGEREITECRYTGSTIKPGTDFSSSHSTPRESLTMPFVFEDGKQVWVLGHETGNNAVRITELVRAGEKIENWTELVTIQTLNKSADLGSIDKQFDAYRADVVKRFPGSTVELIRRDPTGVLYECRIASPNPGASEHMVARMLDGTANRFIVHYAVRGSVAMTPKKRAEWFDKLTAMTLMNLR